MDREEAEGNRLQSQWFWRNNKFEILFMGLTQEGQESQELSAYTYKSRYDLPKGLNRASSPLGQALYHLGHAPGPWFVVFFLFAFVCVVLRHELRAFTLSHSTSPIIL
jgi:hypothetical protein